MAIRNSLQLCYEMRDQVSECCIKRRIESSYAKYSLGEFNTLTLIVLI
jgi:hypothetical protein